MPVDRTTGTGTDISLDLDIIDRLIEIYAQAEQRLAADVARRLAAGMDAPTWATDKLAAAGALRRQAMAIMNRAGHDVTGQVAQSLALAYMRGGEEALRELGRQARRPTALHGALQRVVDADRADAVRELAQARRAFPGLAALQRLVFSLASRLSGTHLPVVRWAVDAYRDVIGQTALPGVLLGTATRRAASQQAWGELLGQGVTGFTDKLGRPWNLSSYVEMATRTGVAQAAVEGHLDRLADAGIKLVVVSNAPQECSRCRIWEGAILAKNGPGGAHAVKMQSAISDDMINVQVAGTVAEAIAAGLMHPNCFPGHVLVSAPSGVRAADARWYEGDLVVIHTASGNELPVTPNHPVLTSEGWIPAGLLQVGQDVLSYSIDDQRMLPVGAGVRPGYEQVPARISEVFDSLRQASSVPSVRVPAAAEQFHGDGLGSDVEVVLADSLLRRTEDASLGEGFEDGQLVLGGTALGALLPSGSPFEVFDGPGGAAYGFVGCGHLRVAFVRTHSLPLAPLGEAPVGAVSAHQESLADRGLGPVDENSDFVLRHASQVQADGFVDPRLVGQGSIPSSFAGGTQNAGLAEALADPGGADVDGGRQLARRLTSQVSTDQIVEINVRNFAGHVYNLESGEGWYVASGIVVHNCRHSLSAFLPGVTKIPTHTADPEGDKARQELRRLERETRKAKLQASAVIDPKAQKAADAKVRDTQAAIRAHVKATAHLGIRRKPEREQLNLGNTTGEKLGRPAQPSTP